MNNLFQYKDCYGSAEVSLEDGCVFGKLQFIDDLVTYEAIDISSLEKEFKAAVDDYIETCEGLGRDAQKPYKGSFNIRIGKDLHREAACRAQLEGKKLNELVKESIENHLRTSLDYTVTHIHKVEETSGRFIKTVIAKETLPIEFGQNDIGGKGTWKTKVQASSHRQH